MKSRSALIALIVLAAVLVPACGGGPGPGDEAPAGDAAPPELTWDEWVPELRNCPRTDRPWRKALAAAGKAEAPEAFTDLAAEIAAAHPERWEPAWAAGESLFARRQASAAAPHYRRAIERARSAGDPTGVACSGNRLGALAYFDGDMSGAEALYREALEAAALAERDDLASFVHNNLAGLLVETGEYAEARAELELAESGLQALGLAVPARRAAYNRGAMLLILGDATAARELLERLYGEAQEADDRYVLDSAALALGRIHRIHGDLAEAAAWYRRVSGERAEMVARAQFGLGRLALMEGRLEEAIDLLGRAAGTAAESHRQVSLLARTFAAEAELRAGKTDEARARFREVIAESDEVDAQTTAWGARWLLGRSLLATDDAEARKLLAAAVAILDGQGEPLDPRDEGLYFLRERADPYVDLAVAIAAGAPGGDRTAAASALEIAGRAQARALRPPGGGDIPRATPLDALQRGLAAGDLLVNYLIGERAGLVLAVTRDAARAVPIAGRGELIGPLTDYRSALLDARQDADGSGDALSRELLAPIAGELDAASRVFVVPDRDLALVPFAALRVTPDGERLGLRVELATMPVAGAPDAWSGSRAPVLLAGAPRLEGSGFPELAWAGYELSRLRETWGAAETRYLGGDALTASALEALDLRRYPTVHFATHALASTRDPRRCGVVLSGGERLGMDRITGLALDDALVVLSACRTGEGELLPGQGVIGLGWAFLRAGARGVVVTLWAVDDEAAARLMVAFHRELRDGVEPVRALALARREMAREGADPSTWAAFSIVVRPAGL